MECPKCKGMMMLERFSDFFLVFYAWKCINCGAIIDRTDFQQSQKESRSSRISHSHDSLDCALCRARHPSPQESWPFEHDPLSSLTLALKSNHIIVLYLRTVKMRVWNLSTKKQQISHLRTTTGPCPPFTDLHSLTLTKTLC